MAVNAKAAETYDSKTLKEDLTEAEKMISPDETPVTSMIANVTSADREFTEWAPSELNAVDTDNAVAEGEDDPAVDDATPTYRHGNYCQIMDKVAKVTDTAQRINGDAALQIKMAKQVAARLKELKRDRESIFTLNQAGSPGAGDGAGVRKAAGIPTQIANVIDSSGAAIAPAARSDAPHGYPNAQVGAGVAGALTEDVFNDAIQIAWTEGGEPTYAVVNPGNKRLISQTFNGYATKYKDADDGKIVNSIGIYESDFGTVSIVPSRFTHADYVMMLDPEHLERRDLQPVRQLPLARTGHTENRLVQYEGCAAVTHFKAHALIIGVAPAAPAGAAAKAASKKAATA